MASLSWLGYGYARIIFRIRRRLGRKMGGALAYNEGLGGGQDGIELMTVKKFRVLIGHCDCASTDSKAFSAKRNSSSVIARSVLCDEAISRRDRDCFPLREEHSQ